MKNRTRQIFTCVFIMSSIFIVNIDFAQAKRGEDRERGEYVETLIFDEYRYAEDNRADCRDYRRNEDRRCNSSKYKCTRCKSSRYSDEEFSYVVYRQRERARRSVWVKAGIARGTGSWDNRIMPRGWPKCGVIRQGQRDTLNRICRDAGYGRALEHTIAGHGRCARTANDGRNWHAWGNGEIAAEVRCSVN